MRIPVTMRFFGELNDLVDQRYRQRVFDFDALARRSIKDLVESFGVPHVEIGLIQRNGTPCSWNEIVQPRDNLFVYPHGRVLPFGEESPDYIQDPEPTRFVLDVHLGRLAAYLRLMGIDCYYKGTDPGDNKLLEVAVNEKRILLSFDRRLLMGKALRWGRLIRSRDPMGQVPEVVERYKLLTKVAPFTRCMACNGILTHFSSEDFERLPEKVRERFADRLDFLKACPRCGRFYWPGTHWEKMNRMLREWGVEYESNATG